MAEVPAGLDDFLNSSGAPQVAAPAATAAPPGLDEFISQEQYGTPGQQALAGVEGFTRGALPGLSDLAETKLGLAEPEDIKGRMQANPATSIAGSIAGTGALVSVTGGLAAPIEAALGGGLGATAVGLGTEGALLGAGNAVSDYALGDSDLTAQKVLSDVGMGTVLGVGGALVSHGIGSLLTKSGLVKGSVAHVVEQAENAGASGAKTAEALVGKGFKPEAPEIAEAADRLGVPVFEGQVSDNPWVQKADSALVHGAPTIIGERRADQYRDAYKAVTQKLDEVVGDGRYTKSELGGILQDSLANQIDEGAKPFNDLYGAIKEETQNIPLKPGSAPAISRNILEIPEVKRAFKSPAASLARDVAEEISSLDNVDDLRAYQSQLNKRLSPTASAEEKYIIGQVSDKLDAWERRAIRQHADDFISKVDMTNPEEAAIWGDKVNRLQGLMQNIDTVDAQYAPFRKKLSELSEWLGKGKIGGPKDAISFIQNRLEPEDVVNKLSSTKYAGLSKFLDKNFPEQAALIREYQKGALKEAASKSGEFSPKVFFNNVNKLSTEAQKNIFHPEELQTVKDAETYIRHIPKNLNMSDTDNTRAFREFFKSPIGAATSNARDFGIYAYLKAMGKLPESSRPNPVALGSELAQKYKKLQAIKSIADRTSEKISDNADAIFNGARSGALSGAVHAETHGYDQKVKRVAELAQNPNAMMAHIENHISGLNEHLPNVSQGVGTTITTAAQFLNSKIPKPINPKPLSGNWVPSPAQKAKFNKYYETVDNPIGVLKSVKNGSFSNEQMEALSVVHPQLLKEMQSNVRSMISTERAKKLSYTTKISLAKFLGEPLDESMTGQAVSANQMAFGAAQMPTQEAPGHKKSTVGGLEKLSISTRTATQTQRLEDEQM